MSTKQPMVLWAISITALFALGCSEDESNDDDKGNGDRDTQTANPDDTGTGDSDTGDSDTGDPPEGDDIVVGTLSIPEEFEGTPVIFSVLYFESDSMSGMPDGFGETTFDMDAVEPGASVEFTSSQADLTGEYSLAVVLYCEGGGNGMFPVAGVDWVGGSSETVTLGPGTGTVDVGELELFLSE